MHGPGPKKPTTNSSFGIFSPWGIQGGLLPGSSYFNGPSYNHCKPYLMGNWGYNPHLLWIWWFLWLLDNISFPSTKTITIINPIGSMGMVYLPTIWLIFMVNVGKYTIHDPMGKGSKAKPFQITPTWGNMSREAFAWSLTVLQNIFAVKLGWVIHFINQEVPVYQMMILWLYCM